MRGLANNQRLGNAKAKTHTNHLDKCHSEPAFGEPCTPTQGVESSNTFLYDLRGLRSRRRMKLKNEYHVHKPAQVLARQKKILRKIPVKHHRV